jgi:hypothetical protein
VGDIVDHLAHDCPPVLQDQQLIFPSQFLHSLEDTRLQRKVELFKLPSFSGERVFGVPTLRTIDVRNAALVPRCAVQRLVQYEQVKNLGELPAKASREAVNGRR